MHLRATLVLSALAAASTTAASAIPAVGPRQASTTSGCTNPPVRKEWRELTTDEKSAYLRAAVCLRNLPKARYAAVDAVRTRLDDLVYTHAALNTQIHFVAAFLPWHRWYVQLHEDLLRQECGYAGLQPYWDWSIDADARAVLQSPVWDPTTGFGGDGVRITTTGNSSTTPGFAKCVVDGPFANTTLHLGMGYPDENTPGNRPHCFVRELNGGLGRDTNGDMIKGDMQVTAYDSRVMDTIHGMETFVSMSAMLEGLPHAQVHSIIFGDMGPATSPNEPLFFLHHANVDRAWARWQGRNATRLADYAGFLDQGKTTSAAGSDVMPVLELVQDVAGAAPVVGDYMDINAGPLCYTYSSM